ncbi:MAG: hypothetical protein HQK49_14575 [Oligoflexia bacterium]|nr:hypothetical protein [Oligoflexia bacterium]
MFFDKFFKNLASIFLVASILLGGVNLTSCDFLRQTKRKVKGVLFGTNVKEQERVNASKAADESVPTTEDGKKYDNTQIIEITDHKKAMNLCSAFIQTPTPALREMFINEMREKATTMYDEEKLNVDLSSCIQKLVPMLEEDQSVIEVVYELHTLLSGKNKKVAGEAFAKGFDFHPQFFVKNYFKKIKKLDCHFLTSLPPEVELDQKSSFLNKRIDQLMVAKKGQEENAPENIIIETCIDDIRKAL